MNSLPIKTLIKGQSSKSLFRPLSAVNVLTMVRMAVFPVVFGASLVILAASFYNRRKLFPEVETINQRKARESHYQAVEFRTKVAEGVKLRRADK